MNPDEFDKMSPEEFAAKVAELEINKQRSLGRERANYIAVIYLAQAIGLKYPDIIENYVFGLRSLADAQKTEVEQDPANKSVYESVADHLKDLATEVERVLPAKRGTS